MQGFRKRFYDIKLGKSTKKVLSSSYLGISILTQPFVINLESFPHGARGLVTDMGRVQLCIFSLPAYLIMAPPDALALPTLRRNNPLSDQFLPEPGDTQTYFAENGIKGTLSDG